MKLTDNFLFNTIKCHKILGPSYRIYEQRRPEQRGPDHNLAFKRERYTNYNFLCNILYNSNVPKVCLSEHIYTCP